jgi:hypothetical protein
MRTDSTSVPSCPRHRVFSVAPSSQSSVRTGVSSGGSSGRSRSLAAGPRSVICSGACPAK